MEKLYYTNQYIRDFTAEIIEIKEVENKYHVLLDKTTFSWWRRSVWRPGKNRE